MSLRNKIQLPKGKQQQQQKTLLFGFKALVLEQPSFSAAFLSSQSSLKHVKSSLSPWSWEAKTSFLLACPPPCGSRKLPRCADSLSAGSHLFSVSLLSLQMCLLASFVRLHHLSFHTPVQDAVGCHCNISRKRI